MRWVLVRVDPWPESTCDTNQETTATNHNHSHCSANQGLPPRWPLTSDPEQSTGPCHTAVCSAFKPRPSFCFPSFVGQSNLLGFPFQSTLRRSPSFPSQLWLYPQCLSCPTILLSQALQGLPVLFQNLSFGVAALGQLPSLLSAGFNLSFRGLPGFNVPFEFLPDFLLLEPFLFQDNFSFVASLSTLGSYRPSQSWSRWPLLFHTPSLPLVSTDLPFFGAFFVPMLPRSFPLCDVQSCFMKCFCHVFPPRLFCCFLWSTALGNIDCLHSSS